MGHDLNVNQGRVSMAFNADETDASGRKLGPPWHGLGVGVSGAMTAKEAMALGGLDFQVDVYDLFAAAPYSDNVPRIANVDGRFYLDPREAEDAIYVPTRKGIFRSDNKALLGVVSDGYKPIQNVEAFDFLDALVSNNELLYETVGAFGAGERLWMLTRLPKALHILNTDDVINPYILAYNSHDGTMAFRTQFTPTRVVCWNTCSYALAKSEKEKSTVSIRHTGKVMDKLAEARKILGLATSFFDDFGNKANALASTPVSEAALQAFFNGIYPTVNAEERKTKRDVASTIRHTLTGLFKNGIGQDIPGIGGSMWAAVNAVTEFVDHHQGNMGVSENRLQSNWFGEGAKIKDKAFTLALASVGKSVKTAPDAIANAAAVANPEPIRMPASLVSALATGNGESN